MASAPLPFSKPEPFKVDIPDADLAELKKRLVNTRWAHDYDNEDGRYGVRKEWLTDLVKYWTDKYDWRAQEKEINKFPQFKVQIDGEPIHYIHVRGVGANPVPIILSHGWPWTFWDWRKVIGPLTNPAAYGGNPADVFDVVVPSLPGFAFSTPTKKAGRGARQVAAMWHTLMHHVLGYEKYAAGGGDWGSTISGEIGHGYSNDLTGVWLTLPHVPGVVLRDLSAKDFAPDEQWMFHQMDAVAKPTIQSHFTVHRIEPQTIAYGLSDSPAGLASWILGRRATWGDHDGDVFELFDRDFLCTTASIYWFTNSIASSMRIYFDHYKDGRPPQRLHDRPKSIEAPTGFGIFPKELLMSPRTVAEANTNLQRWSILKRGGHYAPSEQPDTVVHELREFFRPLRKKA